MNTISKDNVGSVTLLTAMLATTLVALFSAVNVEAKPVNKMVQVETIEVTATRIN